MEGEKLKEEDRRKCGLKEKMVPMRKKGGDWARSSRCLYSGFHIFSLCWEKQLADSGRCHPSKDLGPTMCQVLCRWCALS